MCISFKSEAVESGCLMLGPPLSSSGPWERMDNILTVSFVYYEAEIVNQYVVFLEDICLPNCNNN